VTDDIERQRREEELRRRAQAEEERQRREVEERALREAQKALLGNDKEPDYPDDSDDA